MSVRRSRSLIALALLLFAVAATVSAARPANVFAAPTDASTDLAITETGSPPTQDIAPGTPFKNITWTMVVTNNGPLDDTNVSVGDPLPPGATYVDSTTTQGTCTGSASFNCSLGTLPTGSSVTITLVTTPTLEGLYTNTAVVSGDLPETDPTNNTATASSIARTHSGGGPGFCLALLVKPKELTAGRLNTLHITIRIRRTAVPGVRARITGPGIFVITRRSGAQGNIVRAVKPTKPGIVVFRPARNRVCQLVLSSRAGVARANIPVTG